MRSRVHARQTLSTLVPVLGTSLMMVFAASGGYDDAEDQATVEPKGLALV